MRVLRNLLSKGSSKASDPLAEAIEILRKSCILDPIWYRQVYADLRDTPLDVARHYLEYGAREGRNPNPLFNTEFYRKQNPKVRESGENPLLHYIRFGAKEALDPHPLFDTKYYYKQIPDLQSDGMNPLEHFLSEGWKAGLRPSSKFEPNWHRQGYTNVRAALSDVLSRYVQIDGQKDYARQFDRRPFRRRPMSAEDSDSGTHVIAIDVRKLQMDIALASSPEVFLDRPIGIFIHLFYDGLAHEIASYIAGINLPKKVYITTDTNQKKEWIAETFIQVGINPDIIVVPNRGFDIAPFLLGFPDKFGEHDICLKLHGKRSLHNPFEFGDNWRSYLYDELIGDSDRVNAVVRALLSNPSLGILMPQHWRVLEGWIEIGANYEHMQQLLKKIDVALLANQQIEYPSGSMFWFKSEALSALTSLNLKWSDFDEASGQRDSTLAHAIERSVLFFCARADRNWAFIPLSRSEPEIARSEVIQIIQGSGEFDAPYYLTMNEDVKALGIDPIVHWVDYGAKEGRNPSASFDTKYYFRIMRRHTRAQFNPLVHYVLHGRTMGLKTKKPPQVPASVKVDDLYAGYSRPETGRYYVRQAKPIVRSSEVKLIAWYFPQFHPFAENDEFWGRGFTEWTNTTKTVPMFKGHYQPRLPGELGFYDTRIKDVLVRQIELAKQYGVHGFCLHHYFFSGKPVMRAPYNLLVANPDLDIPFCLNWANEPWTVNWDGVAKKTGVLLDQRHEPDDDIAFFRDIEPAVRDSRYIKIDGRPLVSIYRPRLFPNMPATIERWRNCFEKAGLADPYLVVVQTAFEGAADPRKYGFDAAIEFPPHQLGDSDVTHRLELYDPGFQGVVRDYEHTVEVSLSKQEPEYRLFRGIMPDWDCTPRRSNPHLFINSAPHRYQRWLEGLCAKTDVNRSPDEKLIFINAWNEWAEGAYLEPDRKYGYAYLDATARALNKYRRSSIGSLGVKVLVAAHIFYTDLLDEFIEHFSYIPSDFDLLITTLPENEEYVLQYLLNRRGGSAKNIKVLGVKNGGADIAPFLLHALREAQNYDVCCKLHSKKTPYNSEFSGWREYLLRNLLGSSHDVTAIIEAFARDPKLGLVHPKVFPPVVDHVEWGSNFELTASLLNKLSVIVDREEQPIFPVGSMFWFRPKALKALLDLNLTLDDFDRFKEGPREPVTGAIVDGTLAHALERMPIYVAKAAGYTAREFQFES